MALARRHGRLTRRSDCDIITAMSELTPRGDPGLAVLDVLFERLQIDTDWAVRGEREFSWWPHTLRQRAWATPIHDERGEPSCHVHIETDLTTGVEEQPAVVQTVSWMNRSATLSALVLEGGRVRLHAAVAVTAGNLAFATELALHATALQLVECSFAADTLVAKGAGRRDVTAHPRSGPRSEPDEMLSLGGLYSDAANPPPQIDFVRLMNSMERCWERATAEAGGFLAEFALDHAGADFVQIVQRQEGLGTALFQASNTEPHPAIRVGLLVAIRMPDEPADAAFAANVLNAATIVAPAAHALGAWWHSPEYGLTCSAFYPSLAFRNDRPEWNYRLFESLVWHAADVARWARSLLAPGRAS